MQKWFMYSFPDSGTMISKDIIYLHDYAMSILLGVLVVLLYLLMYMIINYSLNRSMIHGHLMEVIWTVIPMILLLMLAFPSLKLLYKMDDLVNSSLLTVKVIGNQWFWTYEIEDYLTLNVDFKNWQNEDIYVYVRILDWFLEGVGPKWFSCLSSFKDLSNKTLGSNYKEFDSYMISEFQKNGFRLLDVDHRLVLPLKTNVRLLVTSNDVIHSWAVPSLGVKIDAVPGRLNQIQFNMSKVGLFFGQCSEICGLNHSFMPIVVESVTMDMFKKWAMPMSDYNEIYCRNTKYDTLEACVSFLFRMFFKISIIFLITYLDSYFEVPPKLD